jgi:hypothetical protein
LDGGAVTGILFKNAGVNAGYLAATSTANAIFYAADGSTINGSCTNAGAWTLGATSGTTTASHALTAYNSGNFACTIKNRSTGYNGATLSIETGYNSTSMAMIQFYSNVNTDGGGIKVNGTTPAFYAASDRRIKKNISDMPPTLEKILALKPCQFHLKRQEDTEPKDVGFVAQEMVEVFPNLVEKTDDGLGEDLPEGVKNWTVSSVPVVYLIKAIQEQQAIIEEMKARIAALEA